MGSALCVFQKQVIGPMGEDDKRSPLAADCCSHIRNIDVKNVLEKIKNVKKRKNVDKIKNV